MSTAMILLINRRKRMPMGISSGSKIVITIRVSTLINLLVMRPIMAHNKFCKDVLGTDLTGNSSPQWKKRMQVSAVI